MKKILSEDETLKSLRTGISRLIPIADALYGPSGKYGVLGKGGCVPYVTDSFSVFLDDLGFMEGCSNVSVNIVRKMIDDVRCESGSGSGLACILTAKFVDVGNKMIVSGVSRKIIQKYLDDIRDIVLQDINAWKIKLNIKDQDALIGLATTSSGDKKIGEFVGRIYNRIGEQGSVLLNQYDGNGYYAEYKNGYTLDTSPLSFDFFADYKTDSIELVNSKILLTNFNFNNIAKILDVMDFCADNNYPLVVVAETVNPKLMSTILYNNHKNICKIIVVKTPSFDNYKFFIMDDLAYLTRGKYLDKQICNRPALPQDLGSCKKIIITKKDCQIVLNSFSESEIYANRLARQMEQLTDNLERKRMGERIAAILGQIAVVHIGGINEVEKALNYMRIENATHTVRGAIDEGITAGGCTLLLQSGMRKVNSTIPKEFYDCLIYPFDLLTKGISNSREMMKNRSTSVTLNVATGKPEHMFKCGIVDSIKSIRTAVVAAVSTAKIILSSGGMIYEQNKSTNLRQ